MTAARPAVDLLRVQPDTKMQMAELVETLADHARKYSGIELDMNWVDQHVASMTGRGPVNVLPRSAPMVAAPSTEDAKKRDRKARIPSRSDDQRRPGQPLPPAPQPPARRPWYVRYFPAVSSAIVILVMVTLLYFQNATAWAFLIMIPTLTAASIQRHAYRNRINELGQAVVKEAQYISRYFPDDYPRYFREVKIALHERGADRFIARLPSR